MYPGTCHRLDHLTQDSLGKCHTAREGIRALDESHPEYQAQYEEHYSRALKQSGLSLERVGFMKYLRMDDATDDALIPPPGE